VRFTVGEQDHDAPAGTLVVVPPGAPHTFSNPSGQPAVMLNTFTPDAYVQYFRDMRDYLASGQAFDPAAVTGIMRRYATEPATEFDHELRSPKTEASMSTTTRELNLDGVPVTIAEQGEGQPVLLLHGGGGPQSVGAFGTVLTARHPARVITPVHPGFGGTPRPDSLTTVAGLAAVYARLLAELDLQDVIVIGNSVGGWIAAELALLAGDRIASLVLANACGIEVPGHPVTDVFALAPAELSRLSFYDPAAFRIDPAAMPEAQQRIMAANRETLRVYGGQAMADPGLRARLGGISAQTLVVWGEADQIVDPDYGRVFAEAIPGATFVLIRRAGHMPQMETPDQLARAVWDFAGVSAAG
jgi:pimeloyl-ACP methyl ester carboxylesterase